MKLAEATTIHKEQERTFLDCGGGGPCLSFSFLNHLDLFSKLFHFLLFVVRTQNQWLNVHFINNHRSPLEWLAFHLDCNFGAFAMPARSQIYQELLLIRRKYHELSYLPAPSQEPCKTPPLYIILFGHPHLWKGEKTNNQYKAEEEDKNPRERRSSALQLRCLCYFKCNLFWIYLIMIKKC